MQTWANGMEGAKTGTCKNLFTFFLRQVLDEIRHVNFDVQHVLCHLCMYTQNHWENCAVTEGLVVCHLAVLCRLAV